jgi:NTP pyrophosphatase (non-canonical NTP hydrolase)
MDNDSNATIRGLKQLLIEFRDERDWAKFHDPKNLAEAISIEAAELLELFLWKSSEEVAVALRSDPSVRSKIEEELADVICFSLSLANSLDIDVYQTVVKKIEDNKKKYPVARTKGIATKYNKL